MCGYITDHVGDLSRFLKIKCAMTGYKDYIKVYLAISFGVPALTAVVSLAALDDADENSTNYEFNKVRRYMYIGGVWLGVRG